MQIKQKLLVDLKLKGTGETHARTRVRTRDVETVVDEPPVRGGTNEGPSPTETLMASLIGCTNVITHRLAERMGVKIADLAVDAHAKLDRRGVALEEEIAVPFPEITMKISLRTNATPDQIATLSADLGRYCAIAKVIRAAGTNLVEEWITSPL